MSQVTAFGAREAYFDKLFDISANFQKPIEYNKGYIGHKADNFLCLISINKAYKLRRAISLAGSEQAYSDLINGNPVLIQGLWFQTTPYLDNKFYVHEKFKEKGEDGRDIYEPIETDFTGIDCLLFHKLVFPFKFGVPTFLAAPIPAHPISLFHHIENYSSWEDICRKDPKGQDAKILPKFLKAFKFNITQATQ